MILDLSAVNRTRNPLGTINHEFTVQKMPGKRSDESLDLGTIELMHLSRLLPGDVAPAFEVETLGGDRVALEDFRGKFVLLDFWATWCGPCLRETPYLKATHEAFGRDDRFAMVSLSLDEDREAPRRYVAKHALAWTQCAMSEEKRRSLLADYGATGIPQILLVDPDGRIVANNLRGDQIFKTVEAALNSR
jgi:thiol-disulfide isomerase/thioredoxin